MDQLRTGNMQFWAIELAQKLKPRLGYDAEILSIPEAQISDYMKQKLQAIPILDFLNINTAPSRRAIREEAQPYLFDSMVDEEEIEEQDDF